MGTKLGLSLMKLNWLPVLTTACLLADMGPGAPIDPLLGPSATLMRISSELRV